MTYASHAPYETARTYCNLPQGPPFSDVTDLGSAKMLENLFRNMLENLGSTHVTAGVTGVFAPRVTKAQSTKLPIALSLPVHTNQEP